MTNNHDRRFPTFLSYEMLLSIIRAFWHVNTSKSFHPWSELFNMFGLQNIFIYDRSFSTIFSFKVFSFMIRTFSTNLISKISLFMMWALYDKFEHRNISIHYGSFWKFVRFPFQIVSFQIWYFSTRLSFNIISFMNWAFLNV